jgi:hypothetical protein
MPPNANPKFSTNFGLLADPPRSSPRTGASTTTASIPTPPWATAPRTRSRPRGAPRQPDPPAPATRRGALLPSQPLLPTRLSHAVDQPPGSGQVLAVKQATAEDVREMRAAGLQQLSARRATKCKTRACSRSTARPLLPCRRTAPCQTLCCPGLPRLCAWRGRHGGWSGDPLWELERRPWSGTRWEYGNTYTKQSQHSSGRANPPARPSTPGGAKV